MACPYDKIVDLIKRLDLNDDSIVMNQKIRSIEQDFCNIVIDEDMLSKSMEYINDQVLQNSDASLKFAILFASRSFDSLAMHDVKVRSKMLTVLQTNYHKADEFRKKDINMLYNSITLLGEYYHRIRLVNGVPITVLGESLMEQLINELSDVTTGGIKPVNYRLAKLVLSQITLNGKLLRPKHKEALDTLLFLIRRNLIEVPNLAESVKALFLMTLDLYYSDFGSLGVTLETMYTKYLLAEDHTEQTVIDAKSDIAPSDEQPVSSGLDILTMKWSDEVPDSFVNSFIENECPNSTTTTDYPNSTTTTDYPRSSTSPQPPKQDSLSPPNRRPSSRRSNHNGVPEDDEHSVRSEGGSIRLYNVNDRLRRAQHNDGGGENGGGENGGNWENNYNSFDRNRRSSSRNSNGQYDNNRNYRNKNNRGFSTYNRPPRFRNNDEYRNGGTGDLGGSRQNLQQSNSRSSSRNGDRFTPRPRFDCHDDRTVSPTLSMKQPFQNSNGGGRGGKDRDFHRHNGFNRHQQQSQQQPPPRQQSRNFSHNPNNRYGSHNSLASDSGTWERRRNAGRHSRGKSEDYYSHDDTRSLHENRNDDDWHPPAENKELIKNARNTVNYMKYLSKK